MQSTRASAAPRRVGRRIAFWARIVLPKRESRISMKGTSLERTRAVFLRESRCTGEYASYARDANVTFPKFEDLTMEVSLNPPTSARKFETEEIACRVYVRKLHP